MKHAAFPISLGPAEEAAKTYWRMGDVVFKGLHPFYKSALRSNFEYAAFSIRQVRAANEFTGRIAGCSSPVDFVDCAMRTWMAAFEDLAQTNGRAMSMLWSAAPGLRVPDATIEDWQHAGAVNWRTAETPRERARARDRMDLQSEQPARTPSKSPVPQQAAEQVAA